MSGSTPKSQLVPATWHDQSTINHDEIFDDERRQWSPDGLCGTPTTTAADDAIGNRRICRGHVQRSNDDSQRPDEDRLTDQSALQSICRLFVRRCQSNDYVDSWRFTRGRSIDDVVLITFVQFRIEFDEPFWIVGHPIPISQPAERRCHYIDQQF